MQNRNYGLDLLRSFLMLIGVLIHASTVMSPYSEWSYSSTLKLGQIPYAIIYATHFFRMEAFFLVAGFFSLLVISKKGKDFYLKNRLKRILAPLLFSMATISPLVIFLSIKYSNLHITDITIGNITIHFWFLLTLMILSILTYIGTLDKIISKTASTNKINLFIYLIAISFIALIANLAIMSLDRTSNGFIQKAYQLLINNTIYYGIFYVVGCAFYKNRKMIDSYNFTLLHMISSLIIYSLLILVIREDFFSGYYLKAIKLLCYSTLLIPSYISSIFLFKKFSSLNIRENKAIKFLVNSAIIIYLFHVPALIYISQAFDSYFYNSYLYYISICLATYLMTFIIYFIVKSNKYTRFMYGLK